MNLTALDLTTAPGASILTRRGIAIPCFVETPAGLTACWFLYPCRGGVMVSRQADGRESNCPLPYARVLVDEATAARCREAEEERQLAAQIVVRCSGRVNNGRAHGFKSLRGRR